jgi:hypothetical protein
MSKNHLSTKTALEADTSGFGDTEKRLLKHIKQHSWIGIHVGGSDEALGFSYTIGLWHQYRVPEVLLYSLPAEISHQIFTNIVTDLKKGLRLDVQKPVSGILEHQDVYLKPLTVDQRSDRLIWCDWFYQGNSFEAQQLFWPDRAGNFPWDGEAAASYKALQHDFTAHAR